MCMMKRLVAQRQSLVEMTVQCRESCAACLFRVGGVLQQSFYGLKGQSKSERGVFDSVQKTLQPLAGLFSRSASFNTREPPVG